MFLKLEGLTKIAETGSYLYKKKRYVSSSIFKVFWIVFLFVCVCVRVYTYMHIHALCMWVLKEARRAHWIPGAEVRGKCESPDVGSRNQTWVP